MYEKRWNLLSEHPVILLGEDSEDTLDTTQISVKSKKKYNKVVETFNNYFKVQKMSFSSMPDLLVTW